MLSYVNKHLLLFSVSTASALDWGIAAIPSIGYDKGHWKRSPTGSHYDIDTPFHLEIEGKIKVWKMWPTLRFGWRKEHFDFSTWQAPIQRLRPRIWSLHAGFTWDLKYFNLITLLGFDDIEYNPRLVEWVNGKLLPHSGTPSDHLLSAKISIYKIFDIFKRLKVGPEIGLQYFFMKPEFELCRTAGVKRLFSWAGIRIQWGGK